MAPFIAATKNSPITYFEHYRNPTILRNTPSSRAPRTAANKPPKPPAVASLSVGAIMPPSAPCWSVAPASNLAQTPASRARTFRVELLGLAPSCFAFSHTLLGLVRHKTSQPRRRHALSCGAFDSRSRTSIEFRNLEGLAEYSGFAPRVYRVFISTPSQ